MFALRFSVAEEGRRERESYVYFLAQRPYTICVVFCENYPMFTILSVANLPPATKQSKYSKPSTENCPTLADIYLLILDRKISQIVSYQMPYFLSQQAVFDFFLEYFIIHVLWP